jgi:hypothetical protein
VAHDRFREAGLDDRFEERTLEAAAGRADAGADEAREKGGTGTALVRQVVLRYELEDERLARGALHLVRVRHGEVAEGADRGGHGEAVLRRGFEGRRVVEDEPRAVTWGPLRGRDLDERH